HLNVLGVASPEESANGCLRVVAGAVERNEAEARQHGENLGWRGERISDTRLQVEGADGGCRVGETLRMALGLYDDFVEADDHGIADDLSRSGRGRDGQEEQEERSEVTHGGDLVGSAGRKARSQDSIGAAAIAKTEPFSM